MRDTKDSFVVDYLSKYAPNLMWSHFEIMIKTKIDHLHILPNGEVR